MGKVIDITARLGERAENRERVDPEEQIEVETEIAPSGHRVIGERPDGAIDIAAWRAKWRPIFSHDFTAEMPDGSASNDGLLRWFHDSRSNSLELFTMNADGVSTRLVLPPTVAMQMLVSLNGSYGFDPEGRDGSRLSDWDDGGGTGPRVA